MKKENNNTSNNKPSILGNGLIALDFIYENTNSQLKKLYSALGGTCGNILTILSFFGWDSYPVLRIGNDNISNNLLDEIKYWKLHTDFIQYNENDTPAVIVEKIYSLSKPPRHSFSFKCPCCNKFLPRFKPITLKQLAIIQNSLTFIPDVYFFDRVTPSALKMGETLSKKGTLVIFEPPVIKDTEKMRKAFEISNIVKFSDQRNGKEIIDYDIIKAKIPDLEILTLGEKGLKYRLNMKNKDWKYFPSIYAPKIKDTAGSGDWSTAALIDSLGRNGSQSFRNSKIKDIEQALDFGQAFSVLNCGYYGARGAMYNLTRDNIFDYAEDLLSKNISEIKINQDNNAKEKQDNNIECSLLV